MRLIELNTFFIQEGRKKPVDTLATHLLTLCNVNVDNEGEMGQATTWPKSWVAEMMNSSIVSAAGQQTDKRLTAVTLLYKKGGRQTFFIHLRLQGDKPVLTQEDYRLLGEKARIDIYSQTTAIAIE